MATAKKAKLPVSGKYTGPLADPIYEPIGLLGGLPGVREAAQARAREQQILKFRILFNWHGIDPDAPNAWSALAIALALAHVPGMKVVHELKRARGRKKSWKAGLGLKLVRDVENLRAKKPMTTLAAIQALKKNIAKGWSTHSEANLITRHREARKAEQRRRALAKQLMASPSSQMMGGIFGISPPKTDENR
jgi:hypothetical protein